MDYKVALYIRLSREDEDKTNESESIINQKSLLMQYTKEKNLEVYDTYIDDGYSGTNFDRPAFNKLIEDIENKKINMVITKDMSRLGRDYVETGNLVEKYFPSRGVRYIAVTDNIDTYLDSASNDIAPFKAIMNDMYAKDISKKIRSSLKAKMKEGKYIGGRAPYGYKKDKKCKNHLVIDKEQSIIVQRIFAMALEGLTPFKIAKKLTDENIKPPSAYYDFNWTTSIPSGKWSPKTIKDILTNSIYTGDMVQNKNSKVNYKIKKVIKNSPQDYIKVPNTHTPIVDKKNFSIVQKTLPKNKGRIEKKESHLLDGLLYCGECGHHISITPRRKKDNRCYTICNYYRTYIKDKVCTVHSNNYDELEQIIIGKLKESYSQILNEEKIKKEVLNILKKEKITDKKKELTTVAREISILNSNLDTLYLDKINNVITDTQYQRIKEKLERKLYTIEEKHTNLKKISKDQVINIDDYLAHEYTSRELVLTLIDRIDIHQDKTIDIKFTFNKEL